MTTNTRFSFIALTLLTGLALVGCGAPDDQVGTNAGAIQGSGLPCSVDSDCLFAEECDDSICKLHGSDDGTSSGAACTVDADCAAGQECDDGACKAHGGAGGDDDGGAGGADDKGGGAGGADDNGGAGGADDKGGGAGGTDDNGGPAACTSDAECGAGEKCDNGVCKLDL